MFKNMKKMPDRQREHHGQIKEENEDEEVMLQAVEQVFALQHMEDPTPE